jgi:tRNA G18 (ribose-2'-O)-methylase SpoU
MAFEQRAPRESNQMVFGIRAVIEAIRSGKEIESLYIQRGLGGGLLTELKGVLTEYQLQAQQVPVEKLNRLTLKNHQGVVAYISPITYQKVEDIIPQVFEKGEAPLILVLDGITDVRNMGAIARTAECAGSTLMRSRPRPVHYTKYRFAGMIILCKRYDFYRNRACNWCAVPKKLKKTSTRRIILLQPP